MDVLELAKNMALAALDKKAVKIVMQDLRGKSDLCQYQMVCSGRNEKQTQAICQNIEDVVRQKFGIKPLAVEGKQTGHWILLDFGAVIVHIFEDSIRKYYAVESLWPGVKEIPVP